jgi:cephalosporin hydroxylase
MNLHNVDLKNLGSISNEVQRLLREKEFPRAWKILEASSELHNSVEFKLLQCKVLGWLGRFEMCKLIAEEVLEQEPCNPEALQVLKNVSSATEAPERSKEHSLERSYNSAIPQPFLGRIQDSGHHYTYKGIQMVKSPFDIALYPLLIWDLKPRTIFEIGSKEGGSALWLADLTRNFQIETSILSVDILQVTTVIDERVSFLGGDGRRLENTFGHEFLQGLPHPWLVIEDADHSLQTSLAVLNFFHSFLQKGDYVVIEDGIISDLYPKAFPGYTSGPHLALKEFLPKYQDDYAIDARYCDFYGYNVTWSPNGFLKKIR